MNDKIAHDPDRVRAQYAGPGNFDARVELHRRFGVSTRPFFPYVFDRIFEGVADRIIDVGAGTGNVWTAHLDQLPAISCVVCVDLSQGMTTAARARIADPRFRFVAGDAQGLPFASGTFDVVVANHMLYHVPDIDEALSEFARVLRPGGRLVAATNGQEHMEQLRDLIRTTAYQTLPFTLENGGVQLERHFDDVVCEPLPSYLHVTEPEPILDYIRSMGQFWAGIRSEDEVRREVEETIAHEGAFRIDTAPGVFTAVRR